VPTQCRARAVKAFPGLTVGGAVICRFRWAGDTVGGAAAAAALGTRPTGPIGPMSSAVVAVAVTAAAR
jgi:hypothetical protein